MSVRRRWVLADGLTGYEIKDGSILICTVANRPHGQNRINNVYLIRIDYQSLTGLCSFHCVEPLFRPIWYGINIFYYFLD